MKMGNYTFKAYKLPDRQPPTGILGGFMYNWCGANTSKYLLNWELKEISP